MKVRTITLLEIPETRKLLPVIIKGEKENVVNESDIDLTEQTERVPRDK